jgi:hypothetical protein
MKNGETERGRDNDRTDAGLILMTLECSTIGTDVRGISVSIFLASSDVARGRQVLFQWFVKIFGDQMAYPLVSRTSGAAFAGSPTCQFDFSLISVFLARHTETRTATRRAFQHRHCEPPGRANARPMTGSAKQSRSHGKEWIASSQNAPRNDGNPNMHSYSRGATRPTLPRPPHPALHVRDDGHSPSSHLRYKRKNLVQSCESGFWRSGPARRSPPFAMTNICWEVGIGERLSGIAVAASRTGFRRGRVARRGRLQSRSLGPRPATLPLHHRPRPRRRACGRRGRSPRR